MDPSISLALTSALIFLVLSSRIAVSLVRRVAGMTDDMSAVARTVLFGLIMVPVIRMM